MLPCWGLAQELMISIQMFLSTIDWRSVSNQSPISRWSVSNLSPVDCRPFSNISSNQSPTDRQSCPISKIGCSSHKSVEMKSVAKRSHRSCNACTTKTLVPVMQVVVQAFISFYAYYTAKKRIQFHTDLFITLIIIKRFGYNKERKWIPEIYNYIENDHNIQVLGNNNQPTWSTS